jgi:hypothetical protein
MCFIFLNLFFACCEPTDVALAKVLPTFILPEKNFYIFWTATGLPVKHQLSVMAEGCGNFSQDRGGKKINQATIC